ncbi:uncharacterized protein MONOS_10667 [Monocercomonoides exilis]|uniref:uncharacterized protein n=1 Tax=Monocercomonoides exilis TaxID=2049356 RepID=UPI0035599511|nr:hypothetical protein MONOS_10667 [Monocercomonoides exilis]
MFTTGEQYQDSVTRLLLTVDILAERGWVRFSFEHFSNEVIEGFETESEASSELWFSIDGIRMDSKSLTSQTWIEKRYEMSFGRHVLAWEFVTLSDYRFTMDGARIRQIAIGGTNILVGHCSKCPAGWTSTNGECQRCKRNTFSAVPGSARCEDCKETEYADEGSATCIERKPCTEKDMTYRLGECELHNGAPRKKKTYWWIEPRICITKSEKEQYLAKTQSNLKGNEEPTPKDGEVEGMDLKEEEWVECGSCGAGQKRAADGVGCVACEQGTYRDGTEEDDSKCRVCEAGHAASLTLELEHVDVVEDVFDTWCIDGDDDDGGARDGFCATKGWIAQDDHLNSGHFHRGNVQSWLLLDIESLLMQLEEEPNAAANADREGSGSQGSSVDRNDDNAAKKKNYAQKYPTITFHYITHLGKGSKMRWFSSTMGAPEVASSSNNNITMQWTRKLQPGDKKFWWVYEKNEGEFGMTSEDEEIEDDFVELTLIVLSGIEKQTEQSNFELSELIRRGVIMNGRQAKRKANGSSNDIIKKRLKSIGGAIECSACSSGTFAKEASTECAACPAGTFSNEEASECTPCDASSFSSHSGSSKCNACGEHTRASADRVTCVPDVISEETEKLLTQNPSQVPDWVVSAACGFAQAEGERYNLSGLIGENGKMMGPLKADNDKTEFYLSICSRKSSQLYCKSRKGNADSSETEQKRMKKANEATTIEGALGCFVNNNGVPFSFGDKMSFRVFDGKADKELLDLSSRGRRSLESIRNRRTLLKRTAEAEKTKHSSFDLINTNISFTSNQASANNDEDKSGVEVRIYDGSPCFKSLSTMEVVPRSAVIRVVCNPTAGVGHPQLISPPGGSKENPCEHVFEWESAFGCRLCEETDFVERIGVCVPKKANAKASDAKNASSSNTEGDSKTQQKKSTSKTEEKERERLWGLREGVKCHGGFVPPESVWENCPAENAVVQLSALQVVLICVGAVAVLGIDVVAIVCLWKKNRKLKYRMLQKENEKLGSGTTSIMENDTGATGSSLKKPKTVDLTEFSLIEGKEEGKARRKNSVLTNAQTVHLVEEYGQPEESVKNSVFEIDSSFGMNEPAEDDDEDKDDEEVLSKDLERMRDSQKALQ